METNELQYILDHSPLLKPLRARVCAKDQLPSEKPHDVKAYIVNTHNGNQPGEHWVALYLKDNKAVYFDSYGLPPFEEILSFVKKHASKTYLWNAMRIQGDMLPVCGVYCLFALDFISRECDLNQILLTRFKPDMYGKNDTYVTHWFQQHYGTYYMHAQYVNKCGQKCFAQRNSRPEGHRRLFHSIIHRNTTLYGLGDDY